MKKANHEVSDTLRARWGT